MEVNAFSCGQVNAKIDEKWLKGGSSDLTT
jgi:hypothetical protein